MAVHDVAVVGAGHNGLVAGLLLARTGLDVVVIEANEEPGGCIWTERLPSGHRLERGAVDHAQIVDLADELGLADFGLEYRRRRVAVGAAFGDGPSLTFPVDETELKAALEPTGDVAGYLRLSRLGAVLFDLIDDFSTPPTPTALAAALHSLPQGDELMRLMIASADSVLAEHLTDPYLASAVAMYGAHSQVPSFMPGTGSLALLLPASLGDAPARPVGGSAALVSALVAALEAAGGRVRLGAAVTKIEDHGATRRVSLSDGDTVETERIVSTLDIRRITALIETPSTAMKETARRAHDGGLNVGELKIDLAFDRRPSWGPLEAAPDALWMVQSDREALRHAYGDILAGRLPSRPAFMWACPSETDPTAVPDGGAVAWISAFMPLRPQSGAWTEELEREAADRILDGFASVTGTDLRREAVATVITGPTGWAERIGSTTGNPNHLDLTLDQMLGWRPPGSAGYRTTFPWLYLSGAGTHPGGGLSGVPGKNAAEAVMADLTGYRRPRNGGRLASLRAALELYRSMRR